MAKQFLLQRQILIPSDIKTVWDFFSSPENLAKISPEYLDFKIIHCPETEKVYTGMKIEYKVRPVLNIPIKWESLIQDVVLYRQFKDIQTKGPYRVWEHTHLFEATTAGVLMTDHVLYEMPVGFLGNWANSLFVSKQLKELFDYRTEKIKKLFPQLPTPAVP